MTGKSFWIWDAKSLHAFVAGSLYVRLCAPGAARPAEPVQVAAEGSVPMSSVVVPSVAAKLPDIALALYNQEVLSRACGYSFPSLATALVRCKRSMAADGLAALRCQCTAANVEKHSHFGAADLDLCRGLLLGLGLDGAGPPCVAGEAPATPKRGRRRSRSRTPPPGTPPPRGLDDAAVTCPGLRALEPRDQDAGTACAVPLVMARGVKLAFLMQLSKSHGGA